MAYSIPDCFMIAFAAGLIFAVVYEILRIIRIMFPFQVVTFVCDIVFFVIAAGAVTKLSLSLGNYIRIYTVLGFGAGIFTYITTLGRLLNIVENAVAEHVQQCRLAASAGPDDPHQLPALDREVKTLERHYFDIARFVDLHEILSLHHDVFRRG